MLLLWIICVIYVLCLSCFRVCSLLPCGHLKGKGWPLGSCLWCLLGFCYFPIWYPGTGVVLDCIDSWFLLSFLLCFACATQVWLAVNHNTSITSGEWDRCSKRNAWASELGSCQLNLCSSWGYERLQKSKDSLKDCFENVSIKCWFSRFGNFVLYFKMAAIQEISIFEEWGREKEGTTRR